MGGVVEDPSRGLLLSAQQCHHSTLRRVEVSAVAGWFIQANASRRPLCVRRRHRRFGNITSCECRNASVCTHKYRSRRSSRSTLERRKSRDNKCATPGKWAGANQEREQSAFQLARSRRRAAFSRLAPRLGSAAWTLRPRSRLCFYRWLLVGIRSRVLSVLRLRQLSVR